MRDYIRTRQRYPVNRAWPWLAAGSIACWLAAIAQTRSGVPQSESRESDHGAGRVWTTQRVITSGNAFLRESIAEMVERDRHTKPRSTRRVSPSHQRFPKHSVGANESQVGDATHTTSQVIPGAAVSVGAGFAGMDQAARSVIPPDTDGAVGPTHVVEMINAGVAIYTKSGVKLAQVTLDGFFFSPAVASTIDCFDPHVIYDQSSGRFIACCASGGTAPNSSLLVAVSATSNPTGAWFKYAIDADIDGGATQTNNFLDFPTMGVDISAVYFGGNMFDNTDTFQYVKLWIIPKPQLLGGSPNITFSENSSLPDFVLQPCHTFGTPGLEYIVSAVTDDNGNGNSLHVYGVLNPTSNPAVTLVGTLTVPSFGIPPDGPQKGGAGLVDTGDNRMAQAVFRDGSIWCVHTINKNGRATPRWYRINPSPLQLAQAGDIADAARSFFYPSLAVNSAGDVLFGFSGSSSTEYIGCFAAGRKATDAAGITGVPAALKSGEAYYFQNFGRTRNRWGDYSSTCVDPGDDLAFWTVQEYAKAPSSTWGTWWSKATISPEPAPTPGPTATPTPVGTSNIVTNTNDSGAGSLRNALGYARTHAGSTIVFHIPSSDPGFAAGVFTIKPLQALPLITANGTNVDGTTQTAFGGDTNASGPEIVVSGASAPPTIHGLQITAAGCTVQGLVINGFAGSGVLITGASASGNTIKNCYLGTDPTATLAAGNGSGVTINGGADNNVIGGSAPSARNIISANLTEGAAISGAGTSANRIQGNYIGTNRTGSSPLPNRGEGVTIINGATNNTLGGTASTLGQPPGNVISANFSRGVLVSGTGTTGNLLQGNLIGTTADGASALGNTLAGVQIRGGTQSNTVGGSAPGQGNVISGNGNSGVLIDAATANILLGNYIGLSAAGSAAIGNTFAGIEIANGAQNNHIGGTGIGAGNVVSGNAQLGVNIHNTTSSGNVVQGNLIGTNAAGTIPIGNTFSGVGIYAGASGNTIGGTVAGARNVISGNAEFGVFLTESAGNNVVQGNFIGTNAAGTSALGNAFEGVRIAAGASNNTIGSAAGSVGGGNRILFNGSDGVWVADGVNNHIRINEISGNSGLGIDLGADGVNANDAVDGDIGPNDLQNYPVISAALKNNSQITLNGTLDTTPSASLTIDFYSSPTADASGFGEGQTYLTTASVATNASGHASFSVALSTSVALGTFITATATSAAGSTSEFSLACPVTDAPQSGPTFVVNTTDEHSDFVCGQNDCSLWDAANAANATPGANTITFKPGLNGVITTTLQVAGIILTDAVTITGPGARSLAVGGALVSRVFKIEPGVNVSISGLGLVDGKAPSGSFPDNCGGAILNAGSLSLTNCTLRGSSTTSHGGAILNNGTSGNASATLVNCTLSQNSASASGGAIFNAGYSGQATLNLSNCTLSQNTASQYGGAIYNDGTVNGNASLIATACTFDQNSATLIAGGIYNDALNPDSSGTAAVALRNTILRTGASGENLVNDAAVITSQGFNLSNDAAGGDGTTSPGGFLNAATDRRNTNPLLGSLLNNGGPTDTCRLLSGSPALDKGNRFGLTTDQRLQVRPQDDAAIANAAGGDGSDIGAFELAPAATFSFTATNFTVVEGAANATINVRRSGDTTGVGTVKYASSANTAQNGSDFNNVSGTLTFAPGFTTQAFNVPILNNETCEPIETLNLALGSTTGGTLAPPTSATLTIFDEDCNFTISGRVANSSGAGIPNIQITRTGFPNALTNSSGNYTFTGVKQGNYTIAPFMTPALAGMTFNPPSYNVAVNTSSLSNISFTAFFTVTGKVSNSSGIGIPNIQVRRTTPTTSVTALTNASGVYTFTGVRSGGYTIAPVVTPAMTGISFFPTSTSISVTTGNLTNINFTAFFSISGRITSSAGAGMANVLVTRSSGGSSTSVVTDANGNYTFGGVRSGTYTITPSKNGVIFSPASRNVTVGSANIGNINFIGS